MIRKTEFAKLVKQFSPAVVDMIQTVVDADDFRGVVEKKVVAKIIKTAGITVPQLMLALLPIVATFAKPVLSDFYVGAIAEGESGNLYFGTNLEFFHNALTTAVHAEQAAILNVRWHETEVGIKTLAVNYYPCGLCRQFMNEMKTASKLQILLPENRGAGIPFPEILPGAFGPNDLGVKAGLFDKQDHQMKLPVGSKDSVMQAALAAANNSYAPYTKGYSGIALKTIDGKIFTGTYVENAAFNPSATPVIVALLHMSFAKEDYGKIERAVLVEREGAKITQADITTNILKALAPKLELQVLTAA